MSLWTSAIDIVRAPLGSKSRETERDYLPIAFVDLNYRPGTPTPRARGRHRPLEARHDPSPASPQGHPPTSTWENAGPAQDAWIHGRASWFTDRGCREANHDFVAVRGLAHGRELGVVCDGMGSSPSAALAGTTALRSLIAELEGGGTLASAVQGANRAVLARAGDSPSIEGTGTTLLALLRQGDRYEIAHVGDSRAYRVDGGGVHALTVDHTFVAEAVQEGTMSLEEAAGSPWRHGLTRHLGARLDVDPDLIGPFSAEEPHLVVLCSDGVHSVLPMQRLEEVVRAAPGLQAMARAIGKEALRLGSRDNVAAVVMQFGADLQ